MLDLEIVAPPKVSTLGRGASFGRLLLFGDMMKTAIYVDGFNLYYRTVRGTPHKWLDLRAIFAKVLKPSHEIVLIKYFTALVSSMPQDPYKTLRQKTYLRALLSYAPEIKIHYGHFLSHEVKAPLARPVAGKAYETIIKTEEKGSDVNLAVHLLNDAWLDHYDCAVVVSNDSDLAEAMRLVRLHHPSKIIGLVSPEEGRTSKQLKIHANFIRPIRKSVLAACQLPSPIPGTSICKPASW